MYCNQCQEAAKGYACTSVGVCGKGNDLSNLMDLLIYSLEGISLYAQELRGKGENIDPKVDRFIMEGLFSTITNANFNDDVIEGKIREALEIRENLKNQLGRELSHPSATFTVKTREEMDQLSSQVGFLSIENEDVRALKSLVVFGLKGLAAYYEHANNLGHSSDELSSFMEEALAKVTMDLSVDELIGLVLKTGEHGVNAMALLDKANTSAYGNPEITKVNIGTRNNPAILISGHDLKDMEELLKQTDGTGVDVYTHSEMLPANYYPAFKKYEHFVGNYGGSWWSQNDEFEAFNGPILFTTNCIVPLKSKHTYLDRLYTTGSSGYPGATHIADRPAGGAKDFSQIIEQAKKCAPPTQLEEGEIVGGFAHNQVMALADKVVDAVKSGAIKKFFVMAGCDGRFKERNYYTEFAEALPQDTVILTAGCAKYRYNKLNLGDIGGIPRVLDAGQCNDSYSLAVIALKLKEVFGLEDINDLPIAYNIAWYEQKAVIVLLALLFLGVKNIHLGPTLPAFLSPNVADVLVKNFGIAGIGTVEDDMKIFLG
ncbi:hydroxylamine reductase [Acetoanaerobium pronyense]|uniref:Hydroxylamine reductase n=1 Tax=Acetoanaerobium pronyense TaxID=1482736 RepID=A0ABS4KM39_9FIRM|nr:hydroxylamine reductase [Acetoanaerobium pronyense]MBP2028839.1 hydroxylamine reductase [Acetoanaerobium pronyense]